MPAGTHGFQPPPEGVQCIGAHRERNSGFTFLPRKSREMGMEWGHGVIRERGMCMGIATWVGMGIIDSCGKNPAQSNSSSHESQYEVCVDYAA